jgi:hypothetical protein
MTPSPKPVVSLALSVCAAGVVVVSIATLALGGASARGWVHWLCSPSVLGSAAHGVRAGGLGVRVLAALEVHWPHFLPALVGLATLVYLWRADARYKSQHPSPTR